MAWETNTRLVAGLAIVNIDVTSPDVVQGYVGIRRVNKGYVIVIFERVIDATS